MADRRIFYTSLTMVMLKLFPNENKATGSMVTIRQPAQPSFLLAYRVYGPFDGDIYPLESAEVMLAVHDDSGLSLV